MEEETDGWAAMIRFGEDGVDPTWQSSQLTGLSTFQPSLRVTRYGS